jgi:N,N'-diacetyllegionaminate synthase
MKKNKIIIDRKIISDTHPVYIVAEAGALHFGSLGKAKILVDIAVNAGADAVKFQLFKAENFISKIASPTWFERMKSKELSYDKFVVIKDYCDKRGITFLASAHDEESFDFLDNILKPAAFKIGSGELQNYGYIEKIASRGKPIILSTGMYNLKQVIDSIKVILKTGNNNLILLHCVTLYPTPANRVNLNAIPVLRNLGFLTGYSDHTIGFHIPLAAVTIGACMIEKHIAIDKNIAGSQDCLVSCNAKELIEMVRQIREVKGALGRHQKKPSREEEGSKEWAQKSIVAKRVIAVGEELVESMICFKRPGVGLSPDRIGEVIGKTAERTIRQGEIIGLKDLK